MAVTAEGPYVYSLTAAGDEITEALFITKMIWRGEAASVFGTDALSVVDPTDHTKIIWETVSPGTYGEVHFITADERGHYAAHGIHILTMTADRGTLDVYVK